MGLWSSFSPRVQNKMNLIDPQVVLAFISLIAFSFQAHGDFSHLNSRVGSLELGDTPTPAVECLKVIKGPCHHTQESWALNQDLNMWAWWHTPLIPAFGQGRWIEFEVS